ncbi:hypothetical protein TRVL_00210 [Trypanosoma vivax]|uniref:Uncharacterized protein n=1 Tax=Trypanosoma vivax (strain Y486) TaxID=1055687 RepID=G0TWT0_TRYVY|nr:hypothetical protein TRVL_00210 [Trypanosoma vivax]CCC48418.1 conserved hypothetical protein [Trypanosoma vivax Y486]
MLRRFSSNFSTPRGAQAVSVPLTSKTATREFHSAFGIFASLVMCSGCVLCFSSWANNICNVRKYGRWRFRNSVDDVIMVSDFRYARYAGAVVGLLFYWFVVGPRKYMYDSSLADIPGNKRFGPF